MVWLLASDLVHCMVEVLQLVLWTVPILEAGVEASTRFGTGEVYDFGSGCDSGFECKDNWTASIEAQCSQLKNV
ncbi:hypothetical protein BsWGS_16289 [Bradybaena similaris]